MKTTRFYRYNYSMAPLLSLILLLIRNLEVNATCKAIKAGNPRAATGVYNILTCGKVIEVYCEMGLNGGGYTFLNPKFLPDLASADLQVMFTDRTNFLMRAQTDRVQQPYGVLEQLPSYRSILLKLDLNANALYADPVNKQLLSGQYLYFGFLPQSNATNNNVQGLSVNGKSLTFTNGDRNPNSYFALFPNFGEAEPTTYHAGISWPMCSAIFNKAKPNPSARLMPVEYFMFTETHWGGGGCFTQTDGRLTGIIGTAIGFR